MLKLSIAMALNAPIIVPPNVNIRNTKPPICPRCKVNPKSYTPQGRQQPYCRDCTKLRSRERRDYLLTLKRTDL